VLAASPVGAGDAFAAAFLLALADGTPLEECLRRGCAAAVS
jgi:sugar/nucleoside kinase (ribokinase family)